MNSKISSSERDRVTRENPPYILLLFAVLTTCYLVTINIAAKIGLSPTLIYALVAIVPAAVFMGAGFTLRISGSGGVGGFSLFQRADGLFGTIHNAMAGASEWLSLFLLIGLVSAFSATNHDGLAIISGIFCGLAFASLFILPRLAAADTASSAGAIAGLVSSASDNLQREKKLFRLTLAIVVIICAFLFLTAQIGAGAQILKFHFPVTDPWAALIILLPVLLAIMTGGMRSLTLANMLLFCLIGTAVILPAIWLSQTITANPVPQLSYGTGALQPILQLERQLAESITGSVNLIFNQGNFAKLSGFPDFTATFIVMMAGSAALPLLFTRAMGMNTSSARTRSVGWILVFLAFILSFIPPFVTFMKFEIYRDLVGLPIDQLGEGVGWLFNWARLEGGHHALVCGKPATSIEVITAACNSGSSHVLLPSDLQFSPLMTFLGAGEIADMPLVFSAIAYAGLLSAAATTIAIALMVIINTIDSELIPEKSKKTIVPIAQRLFISRLTLIILSVVAIWLVQNVSVPVTDFSLWGFALSAGAIFPVMILVIWWPRTTAIGALAGLLAGVLVTAGLLLTIEYGPDWIAQNGDEPVWKFGIGNGVFTPLTSALAGLVIAGLVLVLVSLGENALRNYRTKNRQ